MSRSLAKIRSSCHSSIMRHVQVRPILTAFASTICLTLHLTVSHAFELKKTCPPFEWSKLPHNQWVQLSTCNKPPRKVFHGASALSSERRIVFFFGADTHEKDYDNSVYRLSLTDLSWSRDYEADSLEDYRMTPQGYPMTTTNRPWAMHSFDGWDYDPRHKTLVLVGAPKHASQAIQHLNDQEKLRQPLRPTTWHYNPDTLSWKLIPTQTPNLFAGGFAWDPSRSFFVGHDGHQTYHYDPQHQEWISYLASSVPGYHLRLVYDTFAHTFLSLGNNDNSSDLWSYSSRSVQWKPIMVPQPPLPANGAAIAYNSRHHVLLYVANDSPNPYVNPSGKSATFVYTSHQQIWTRLPVESPPLFGMNFLLQYDQESDVFLHFEQSSTSNKQTAVWAFRYHPL